MTRKPAGEGRKAGGRDEVVEAARAALEEAREAMAEAEHALGQVESEGGGEESAGRVAAPEATWRTLLWTAPAEARVGVAELTEALGVSESWVYQRTRENADSRLPHAKLAGSLVFKCGEVRAWIRDHEQVVEAYRMESAPGELRVETGGAG